MINEQDNDKALLDAWRSTQDLRAPESLDRSVLAEAGRAATEDKARPSWPWLRPMAFAATLVFGVFMVYDIQQEAGPSFSPARQELLIREQQNDNAAAPASSESRFDANMPVEEQEPGVRLNRMPQAVAPASRDAASADTRGARERISESDEAQQQFKASADSAGESLESFRDMASDRLAGSRAVKPAAEAESREPGEPACDKARRADSASWWDCIVELRDNGQQSEAAAEQALLFETYPGFTAPE